MEISKNTKRVLVFGIPESGKTSMIDCLADTPLYHFDITADDNEPVPAAEVQKHGYLWSFVDGGDLINREENIDHVRDFVEGESMIFFNSARHVSAVKIKEFERNEGCFDLLIMVMKAGRVLENTITNYNLARLKHARVPVMCVVTGCENMEPMSEWVDRNAQALENHGLKFVRVVGTCFAKGGWMEKMCTPLRSQSRREVWKAICAVTGIPVNR